MAIFGPLKRRLTFWLAYLNQAQLVRIQKHEWMEAYIKARSDACTIQNIEASWRGAGIFPFNPQRALCTLIHEEGGGEILELEPPKTPT